MGNATIYLTCISGLWGVFTNIEEPTGGVRFKKYTIPDERFTDAFMKAEELAASYQGKPWEKASLPRSLL